MTHPFDLTQRLDLAATPDEVWDAIATGPGMDAWFMGRTEVEGGAGGEVRFTMGGRTQRSTITAFEPGSRFATVEDTAPDGRFMAFEYLIEGREGGSTTLRIVQSGMLGDDWESEFEAMKAGWPMYLATLAEYLGHFTGRRAVSTVTAFRPGAGDETAVWKAVTAAFGLPASPAVGDAVRLPDGSAGTVFAVALPTYLGVRTAEGLFRFLHTGPDRGDVFVLGHQLFAPGDRQAAWDAWLAGTL